MVRSALEVNREDLVKSDRRVRLEVLQTWRKLLAF